jgi:hypothetical protein
MSTVDELLDSLARIGATIRPAGDRLILRAGATAVPAELVWRIRQAKSELLAAVCPQDNETRYWHERFTALTFAWGAGKRDWESAKRLAWGDLQNEWHKKHGRRWPTWLCAGCEKLVGGLDSIDLADGNRVHVEALDCMIEFGRRWRGDARRGLISLGLEPPDFEEIEP